MIQLKSIAGEGKDKTFAQLLEPDLTGQVQNDAQLYAAIRANGKALIGVFSEVSFDIARVETLTPEVFCERWMGD